MPKNNLFSYLFLITYPQAHYLQSLKPKAGERLKKAKNVYCCFLEFNLETINGTKNGLGSSILSKKVKLVVRYFTQHFYGKREGSGSGSGSIPLTNGSGSGSRRPKNTRILQIWIRLRIRIPNTAENYLTLATACRQFSPTDQSTGRSQAAQYREQYLRSYYRSFPS